MKLNKIILAGMIFSVLCAPIYSFANKKKREKGEKPLVVPFLLSGGVQLGAGLPISSHRLRVLNASFSYVQNNHIYLKLKLKKLILSGGIRSSYFKVNGTQYQQSISDIYSKPNFEIDYPQANATAEIISPYLGIGYRMQFAKIDFEPFVRFGVGVLNYNLSEINFESKQSGIQNQTIYFYDLKPEVFFNPSVGLNAGIRISNLLKFTSSIAFDFGQPNASEIQEETIQKPYQTIRKRNIYLQSSMNQIYLMIGLEITPFNKIYSNEKKYEKWKNRMQ